VGAPKRRFAEECLMVSRTRGDVWWLAATSAASNTGNWTATVALSLTVYAKTGSTAWLAATFLFTQVPSALVAHLPRAMADKLNRKRVMIICDLLGAAAYAGMAVTGSSPVLIALGSLAALPGSAAVCGMFRQRCEHSTILQERTLLSGMDEFRSRRVVDALRDRGVNAHLPRGGVGQFGVRVSLPGGPRRRHLQLTT
jgi:hypothetical protein